MGVQFFQNFKKDQLSHFLQLAFNFQTSRSNGHELKILQSTKIAPFANVLFLVGIFLEEKSPTITVASLFSFFVRLFTHRVCTTFCEKFTFTKSYQYLILNASKGLYLEMQNPEGFPFQFFGAMRLSGPFFPRSKTFFRNFLKSSKCPLSIFWCFATEWMFKEPKGPLSHFSAQ